MSSSVTSAESFQGRRVTVMGLGQFGGGLGVVQFLLKQGARVTLTDLANEHQLFRPLSQIDRTQLENLILGQHREQDFIDTDCVVVSPAVKRQQNQYIKIAEQAGVPLTSEMNLFYQHCPSPIIGITGSAGKSTTTTLISHCLKKLGVTCHTGGNIGVSLLPIVDSLSAHDWVILELSSFQLDDLNRIQAAPHIGVVTNFFPNHLDWHQTIEHYRSAKQGLIRWQSPEQFAVLNADDNDLTSWETHAQKIWFGVRAPDDQMGVTITPTELIVRHQQAERLLETKALPICLQPLHLQRAVAATLATLIGHEQWMKRSSRSETTSDISSSETPALKLVQVWESYQPLPHRFETVAQKDGRIFINDSKATTPEATIAALKSLTKPVLLIAGGKDKKVDLTELADVIRSHARKVCLMGETAAQIKFLIGETAAEMVTVVDTLQQAVDHCWRESRPDEVILLSPGCASDGEFRNYEERGNGFRELAAMLTPRLS